MSINQIPKTRPTNHFKTVSAAIDFYKHLPMFKKDREAMVKEKIKEAQIFISPPPCKEGETYFLVNDRYFIQEI